MFIRAISWPFILLFILTAMLLPACGSGTKETPAPAGPQLLFEDDFENSESGWLAADDAQASQGYRAGKFFLQVKTTDLFIWDNPGGNYQDFWLEVQARQISGEPENSYGVLVRYIDDANFYRFDLSGDGYYAISKLENGEWTTLIDWQESAYIKSQSETNLIKIVCQASKMTLYINDQELDSLEDSSFERGDVGLFASTFTGPLTEVEFDNLSIREIE